MAFVGLFHLPETFDFALFNLRKQQQTKISPKKLAHHNCQQQYW